MEVGSYYGYETGIVGLRLFPNPDFDEAAAQKWDAEKILHRSILLLFEGSGATVSSRNVLRLLPRWTKSAQAAGRSRESEMGKPEF